MKLLLIICLLSSCALSGEINFPRPSIGVIPVVSNGMIAYFSHEQSTVTIVNSITNDVIHAKVSQRTISIIHANDDIFAFTTDGNMQIINKNGKVTTEKILDNAGVLSAASIGKEGNFVILGFQDGDEGLKIILFSKTEGKFQGRVIKKGLQYGVLASGRGMVWYNSEKKSFKINLE